MTQGTLRTRAQEAVTMAQFVYSRRSLLLSTLALGVSSAAAQQAEVPFPTRGWTT